MPDKKFYARWASLKTFFRSYSILLCVWRGGGGGGRGMGYYGFFISFFISLVEN